jgi:hypothetical protein
MSTIPMPIPPQHAAAGRRSANSMRGLLRGINFKCRGALKKRSEALAVRLQAAALAAHHPEYHHADLRWIAVWIIILTSVACIWTLDICLMNSVAEYLASIVFPGHPHIVQVARIAVSFGILILEMFISAMTFTAITETEENGTGWGRVWLWRTMGLVLALFITICVIATQIAAGSNQAASTRYLMYGLAGFAFIMHLFLPLADKQLNDAKGYILFRWRNWRLAMAERKATRKENKFLCDVDELFPLYATAVTESHTSPGPFTEDAKTILKERFGAQGAIETALVKPAASNEPHLLAEETAGY